MQRSARWVMAGRGGRGSDGDGWPGGRPQAGHAHRGQLRAVSGICSHQGCRLALAARPARLVCPCHGATFALDGAVLSHRFPGPLAALPRLEVREADGAVQIFAPAPGL